MYFLFAFIVFLLTPAAHGQTIAGERAVRESMRAILQGDSARALNALALPENEFAAADRAYVRCMRERFGGEKPFLTHAATTPFAADVLSVYEEYWWRALAAPGDKVRLEQALKERVSAMLGEARASEDWQEIERRLAQRLAEEGYHAQLGRTPPLRELMLWREQEEREFVVVLPEGEQPVTAFLLDGFASFGWSGYARCDRATNGGWATETALYAVMPRYESIDAESFQGRFLAHEAQHFADKNRFPALAAWELEYRAKLAEIWRLDATLPDLLGKLSATQGDDPAIPHPYANRRVIQALTARLREQGKLAAEADLGTLPPPVIHAAAAQLLREDSAVRSRAR